jgi:hypothetical protein
LGYNLISGTDAEGAQRDLDRIGASRDRDDMGPAAGDGEFGLKCSYLFVEQKPSSVHDALERQLKLAQLGLRFAPRVGERHRQQAHLPGAD